MSQAFVKEGDAEWLHDVAPSLSALILYLTRENNGVRVYEKKVYYNQEHQREVHVMSNGLGYARDNDNRWFIADE
jgi:hypothetical protein